MNTINKQGKSVQEQARTIKKSLGTFTAARYLAKRGYSVEGAMWVLLGK